MFARQVAVAIVLLSTTAALAQDKSDPAKQWGQWRGPSATGVAEFGNPPVEWSETKNIKWKVEIPGHGLSAPIVWDDVIYLQTAFSTDPAAAKKRAEEQEARQSERRERRRGADGTRPEGRRRSGGRDRQGGQRRRGGRRGGGGRTGPSEAHEFVIVALDRKTGRTLWQKTLRKEVPHEGNHNDGSLAPASPITDGKHVYAYFGSRGLFCLTLEGDIVWEKDLGNMKTRNGFGEGSSPALHGDTLVVNWDHEGNSFIVALDKNTGDEIWRRDRSEVTSWSTPVFAEDGDMTHVVVSASKRIRSYDLATGETLWECGGLGANCAPTPVVSSGFLFAMSGYRDPALLAIRYEGATGDLTNSESVAWSTKQGTSYVPSALVYDNTLYYLQKNAGILSCVDAKTGKPHYAQQRLDDISGVYASPVAAADRVYIVGRNGVTYVLKHGQSFEILSVNKLDEEFTASPAIVGNDLYLRGKKSLYRISNN